MKKAILIALFLAFSQSFSWDAYGYYVLGFDYRALDGKNYEVQVMIATDPYATSWNQISLRAPAGKNVQDSPALNNLLTLLQRSQEQWKKVNFQIYGGTNLPAPPWGSIYETNSIRVYNSPN